jgi:hypothetical protein
VTLALQVSQVRLCVSVPLWFTLKHYLKVD